MAINDLYCSITVNLDNKLHCLGIFLDLSKVFDTLNYNILLKHIFNRKQYVVYDQKISSEGNIVCRTTGLNSWAITFLDLQLVIFLSYHLTPIFIIFADDTNTLLSHRDPKQ